MDHFHHSSMTSLTDDFQVNKDQVEDETYWTEPLTENQNQRRVAHVHRQSHNTRAPNKIPRVTQPADCSTATSTSKRAITQSETLKRVNLNSGLAQFG